MAKIADPSGPKSSMPDFWHRIGDAGYLDETDRFWFCGRVAHRVITAEGPMFTVPCEAIFNNHPDIFRSALVGVGKPNEQRPVIVVEPHYGKYPESPEAATKMREALLKLGGKSEKTRPIKTVLFHRSFPVDIRHNAKIFREKLSVWATAKLKKSRQI